jgi:hypothetical protein
MVFVQLTSVEMASWRSKASQQDNKFSLTKFGTNQSGEILIKKHQHESDYDNLHHVLGSLFFIQISEQSNKMKFSSLTLLMLLSTEAAEARNLKGNKKSKDMKEKMPKDETEDSKDAKKGKKDAKKGAKGAQFRKCNKDGSSDYPYKGMDNSQRLLLREGVISEIPSTQCPKDREGAINKNVILVVGDGMVCE